MNKYLADAAAAKEAARVLAATPTETKNGTLQAFADAILAARERIREANKLDMDRARNDGLAPSKLKRLELSASMIEQLAIGLRQVAELPDPVGLVTSERCVPSGLRVRRVRVPLGVVCMIYEARPGVTADAFALCFKAGNACLLKGGREASESNGVIAEIARGVLRERALSDHAISLVTSSDREELKSLLQLDTLIDVVIPRGGEELIQFVAQHSRIPTIQHFKGVCHVYIDKGADIDRAIGVCVTAKTSSPATCNAAECFLVDRAIAGQCLPRLVTALAAAGVEIRGDEAAREIAPSISAADASDFGREFLDLIAAVRIVDGVQGAIDHINRFGSRHTEAILSRNDAAIAAFRGGVDASCVVVNASTRFNDGFQLGLGAEIGISTTKLHAYGPMGLEDLTTQRFDVEGDYQTR